MEVEPLSLANVCNGSRVMIKRRIILPKLPVKVVSRRVIRSPIIKLSKLPLSMRTLDLSTVARSAEISTSGRYRYALARMWDKDKPYLCFILLNPSTANATQDDPTVVRCMQRAFKMGFGGICIVNLFAWRATDPQELLKIPIGEVIGPSNDLYITTHAVSAGMVICGWGTYGTMLNRNHEVLTMLRTAGVQLYTLCFTKNGQPGHPLYVGYDVQPEAWEIIC